MRGIKEQVPAILDAAATAYASQFTSVTSPASRALASACRDMVKRLAANEMSFDRKAEHLFLAALGRQPTPRESRAASVRPTTPVPSTAMSIGALPLPCEQ